MSDILIEYISLYLSQLIQEPPESFARKSLPIREVRVVMGFVMGVVTVLIVCVVMGVVTRVVLGVVTDCVTEVVMGVVVVADIVT